MPGTAHLNLPVIYYAAGDNYFGQLGDGKRDDVRTLSIASIYPEEYLKSSYLYDFEFVDTRGRFIIIILRDKQTKQVKHLYTLGSRRYSNSSHASEPIVCEKVDFTELDQEGGILSVAGTYSNVFIVTKAHKVWTYDVHKESPKSSWLKKEPALGSGNPIQVFAQHGAVFLLNDARELGSISSNKFIRQAKNVQKVFSTKDRTFYTTPTELCAVGGSALSLPEGVTPRMIEGMEFNGSNTYLLTSSGNLYVYPTSSNKPELYPVAQVVSVKCCTSVSVFILTQNGEIYSQGDNRNGELGIGSPEKLVSEVSKATPACPAGKRPVQIACSYWSYYAILAADAPHSLFHATAYLPSSKFAPLLDIRIAYSI